VLSTVLLVHLATLRVMVVERGFCRESDLDALILLLVNISIGGMPKVALVYLAAVGDEGVSFHRASFRYIYMSECLLLHEHPVFVLSNLRLIAFVVVPIHLTRTTVHL
jgi:hypothetical protein